MKQLLVLSGKGGTGKTTISASFAKLSNAKCVADCDVDAPNLHLLSNISKETSPQITPFFGGDKAIVDMKKCVACGKCVEFCKFEAVKIQNGEACVNEFSCEGCGVCELVCEHGAITLQADIAGEKWLYKGEKVFSSATLKMGRGNSGKLVSAVKADMRKSVKDLSTHGKEFCDLAIIDGAPGIGCPVISSVSGVDMVLIVAEPSKSGISDLKRLVKTVKSFEITLAVCVNKFDVSPKETAEIEGFCESEVLHFVGKIPFDKRAISALNSGKTLVETDCEAGQEIAKIFEKVMSILA